MEEKLKELSLKYATLCAQLGEAKCRIDAKKREYEESVEEYEEKVIEIEDQIADVQTQHKTLSEAKAKPAKESEDERKAEGQVPS